LTGYLIEKALAIDNLFVFAVIFSYFRIQPAYQHRCCFGVIGALVFRTDANIGGKETGLGSASLMPFNEEFFAH
jgi:tellurite resistance protein TerC